MSVTLLPDAEALLGDLLRNHPDIQALDARVAGRTPNDAALPWVRVTQLDASDVGGVEHLIDYLVQFDCYAGSEAMKAHVGQSEASDLARTVRAVLKGAQGTVQAGTAVAHVGFTGMARIPDTDFEPARERFVLTASIHAHR